MSIRKPQFLLPFSLSPTYKALLLSTGLHTTVMRIVLSHVPCTICFPVTIFNAALINKDIIIIIILSSGFRRPTAALLSTLPLFILFRSLPVPQNPLRLVADILPMADCIAIKADPLTWSQETQGGRTVIAKHVFLGGV